MTRNTTDDQTLEAFFGAARRVQSDASNTVSDSLLDRITQDALTVQDGFSAAAPTHPARPKGRIAQFLGAIGGWPAMATLATAGVAGLWIGAVPPAFVETITNSVVASSDTAEDDLYLVDPLPGYTLTLALDDGQ